MSLRRAIFPLLVLLAAGCLHKSQSVAMGPTSAPALKQTWVEQPMAMPMQPTLPVKEGTAPLVYLVEAAATVRVVDMDTNLELLNMPVMARQIVSVNPQLGVQVGGATVHGGSLPAEHRYAIYLHSDIENTSRTGVIRPGGAPEPQRGRQP